jgi:FkbM family methyltransferase
MGFVRWLRSKARAGVDWLLSSSSADVQLVGSTDSGWFIKTGLSPRVVYCAGVGKGMTFEEELAKQAPRPILVFDPSPTGIATVEECPRENLEFLPVGVAGKCGTIEFSVPRNPGEGSFSVAQDDLEKVSFECWDLAKIMSRGGDTSIDLLKMDIEGFEYDIVNGMLDDQIPVRQLCVEFHPWLGPGRTLKTIRRLYRAGYRIIYKRRGDYTFLLKDSRFQEMKQRRGVV